MLKKNDPAPLFRSYNQNNELISLNDYLEKNIVVLYFYPKDDTPGCTIEANDFTALAGDFAAAGAVVVGVSKDSCQSHVDFIEKYSLNVELLADTSGEVCDHYGVWQEVEKQGVKKWKVVRSTFIINQQGMLEEALYAVNHEGHAQDILQRVKALSA